METEEFAAGLLGILLQRRQLREFRLRTQSHTALEWRPPWAVLMWRYRFFPSLSSGPSLTLGLPLPASLGWAAGPLRASFWRRLGVIDRSLGNTIRLPGLGTAARQGPREKRKASCKRLPKGAGWEGEEEGLCLWALPGGPLVQCSQDKEGALLGPPCCGFGNGGSQRVSKTSQEDPFFQLHSWRASCVQARAGRIHPIALSLLSLLL